MGHPQPIHAFEAPADEVENQAKVRRSMAAFEQGLANNAIEGHFLKPDQEAYIRLLIEQGLSVEERRDAINAYFGVAATRHRRSGD